MCKVLLFFHSVILKIRVIWSFNAMTNVYQSIRRNISEHFDYQEHPTEGFIFSKHDELELTCQYTFRTTDS